MKKLILSVSVLILLTTAGFTQAYQGSVEYDKQKQDAFVIEYNYPAEAVENAIVQKMQKLGYKGKEEKGILNKDKGFRVYKAAYVTDISNTSMDYIIDVERKSRKEKDVSVLYLIINKDGASAMKGFDDSDMQKAKSFLNNLLPDVEASNLELQIKDQEEVVAKAEKKYKKLQDDKEDMDHKIQKLQDNIKDNLKDQDDTQKEIDNQKQALEALKMKRKPSA
jgi:peptidoglycan hydrolase CwlO-like protein